MTRYLNEELYCELRLRFSLKFRAQKNRTVGIKRARERNIRRLQKNAKRLVTRFYFPGLQNGGPVVRIKLWLRNSYNSFERKVIFLVMLF